MDRTERSEDASLDETLPSTSESSADLGIGRGTAIGRYVVIEPLGSGTMGLVVAAFDPTLDRKVAIKVVRLDAGGSTAGRQRLIREAQAMAKLQHPNVVTVFEVGTFDEQLFLAMEYVAGDTLSAWLKQPGRTRREIVEAFVAAGQGLAAAHRAGIVHRDFKPSNVLVGKDGRVRVADFGLATAPSEAPPPVDVAVLRDSDPGPMGMTRTGSILGTPAYMAPEQHRGEPADARADQYALCVALYEALYGELPFEGTSFLVYRDNVLAGTVREAPKTSDVSPRIRRILLRGLARAPADRYPDLAALLADLSADPAARRRVVLAGGAGAVAVAATALVLVLGRSAATDPCAAAEEPLAGVWTAGQRAALEQSFVATGTAGARDAFARVAKLLDARAGALRAARREACMATVRHEQSEDLLDRRIACVDARAGATSSLISVLAAGHDPDAHAKAIDAVLALPRLEPCADRDALLSAGHERAPEAIRAQVDALETQLQRIDAMESVGMFREARVALDPALAAADKLGWAPLAGRAYEISADLHADLVEVEPAIADSRRIGELAAAAHDDVRAARAWIRQLELVGRFQTKPDEARVLEQAAAMAVIRAGDTPALRGDLEHARGLIDLFATEKFADAVTHMQAALDAHLTASGDKDPDIGHDYQLLGEALVWAERYDEAKVAYDKALAAYTDTVGPDHPSVGYVYHGMGVLYDLTGEPQKALELFKKGEAIDRRAYAPDSVQIGKDLVSIGLVDVELERFGEALDAHLAAIAIFEQHPADVKQEMSTGLADLGFAYLKAGKPKEAVTTLLRALALAEKDHGPDTLEVENVLGILLAAAGDAGDYDQGRAYGQRALAILAKQGKADGEEAARVMGDLADNALLRKAPDEAMTLIDRALAIIEAPGATPLPVRFEMHEIRAKAELALRRNDAALADARGARDGYLETAQPRAAADVRMRVGDALWALGKKADAVAEVKAGLAAVQGGATPDADLADKLRAWLAAH